MLIPLFKKRMLVRWDAVFPIVICLVCKGESYDKENSSFSRGWNRPRNHGAGLEVLEALAEKQALTMK